MIRIGKLAEMFNISGRTLRYYEEVNLLQSRRIGQSRYRYYDQKTIKP
ncbi:MerR family DNA-binding transcriptional regulator [Halothermothrix orenii]|nr:MerR family DNA-binding transcriptional regulator [Halothermothrix orenii]